MGFFPSRTMGKLNVCDYIYIFTSLCLSSTTFATTCYNPPQNPGISGTIQDGNYTSCNREQFILILILILDQLYIVIYPDANVQIVYQQVSMCCRSKEVGGDPPDACLANGLCVNTAGAAPTYWRESCTDPTWTSPYCLSIFDVCSMVRTCMLCSPVKSALWFDIWMNRGGD